MNGNLVKALLVTALSLLLAPAEVEGVYEKEILAFLEEFRMRMCHPIPNLGLPALDPLELGPAKFAVDNKYLIDFTGSIDDFKLHGISDFDVPVLSLTSSPTKRNSMNLTLPLTYLKTLYTAKGSLAYILNLSGDGNGEASVQDFSVQISFRIKASIRLGITGLQIDFHLGGLHMDFENLIEEERINEFLHALVNELGVELLDDIWSYEQGTVVQKVETLINNFVGQYTLADIIKIIAGGGSGEGKPIFEGVEPDCKLETKSLK